MSSIPCFYCRLVVILLLLSVFSCNAYIPKSSSRASKVVIKEYGKIKKAENRIRDIALVHGFADTTTLKVGTKLSTPKVDLISEYQIGISRKRFDDLMQQYADAVLSTNPERMPDTVFNTLVREIFPEGFSTEKMTIPLLVNDTLIPLEVSMDVRWKDGKLRTWVAAAPVEYSEEKTYERTVVKVDKNKGWIIALIGVIIGLIVIFLVKLY